MINDNSANICKSCGTVNGYQTANEHFNFYNTRLWKYHLENTINDICNKYKLYISSHNKTKIHLIFKEINKILPQINSNGKRMININFVLKKIDIQNVNCDNIKITKSKTTLNFYECSPSSQSERAYYRSYIIITHNLLCLLSNLLYNRHINNYLIKHFT